MSRSKSYRRNQSSKKKKAVCQWHWLNDKYGVPVTGRRVGMAARTPHPCSCWGCGNQRHWFGPTRQELKAAKVGDDL